MSELLKTGSKAPDFTLNAGPEAPLRLSDLRGHPVVLAFYPADWSPVCGDQLALYNEALHKLEPYNTRLLGISVDSEWCHAAYSEARGLNFPLLADYEPKGEVSRLYRAYNDKRGASARALYVIDAEGIIRWSYLSPEDVNPGMNGFLHALRDMTGEKTVCEDISQFNEGDHVRGSHTAPVTLVEYGDYECSHCARAHGEVKQVLEHFGLEVRFIFKNFPLSQIHPHAELAAEAAESAAGLGNFWGMHDLLFTRQHALQAENLLSYADTLGLNTKQMEQDLQTRCYQARVKADFESGIENGVNGTPAFFINGERHDGDYSAASLIQAISARLEKEGSSNVVPMQRKAV